METVTIILDWLLVISVVIIPGAVLAEVGLLIFSIVKKRPLKGILVALAITIGIPVFLILTRMLLSAF